MDFSITARCCSPGIWSGVEFVYDRHKGSDVMLMNLRDEDVETLEETVVEPLESGLRFLGWVKPWTSK